ncbi:hypothetical protein MVEN_00175800 [Mycena venus]|uniref:Uncharacterized protein n=1 Tax=Mycena venus TaxID=2733690 RepID=A0A8H6Z3B1_9AGAR|nr:hypothetical protein MVEN_00175800 [Mycena venus]
MTHSTLYTLNYEIIERADYNVILHTGVTLSGRPLNRMRADEEIRSAIAILPPDPESEPRRTNNVEDSLKGGDTAETSTPDIVQSMPIGPTYINLAVYGGTGGSGGQAGEQAMSISQIPMQLK